VRGHSVCFALVAHGWMPPIDNLTKAPDLITGDFVSARFIGDRRDIEARGHALGQADRRQNAEDVGTGQRTQKITDKGVKAYAFFNNRYAGFAPGSIQQFDALWNGV
jgi:uncharacterized protein YecE (DUF72 family)